MLAQPNSSAVERLHVVLDALNIARSYQSWIISVEERALLDIEGLKQCINYWQMRDVPVKVFAPNGFVSNSPYLLELQASGVLFSTPGGLDDDFMLAHAREHGSFVVSNDHFKDHQKLYTLDWLAKIRVAFMWNPNFAPDPNALAHMGIQRPPHWIPCTRSPCNPDPHSPQSQPGGYHHMHAQNLPRVKASLDDEDMHADFDSDAAVFSQNSPALQSAVSASDGNTHANDQNHFHNYAHNHNRHNHNHPHNNHLHSQHNHPHPQQNHPDPQHCHPHQNFHPHHNFHSHNPNISDNPHYPPTARPIQSTIPSTAVPPTHHSGHVQHQSPGHHPNSDRGNSAAHTSSPGIVADEIAPLWEGHAKVRIPVPKAAMGRIIGKGGCNIKALEEATHSSIHVDKTDTSFGDGVTVLSVSDGDVHAVLEQVKAKVELTRRHGNRPIVANSAGGHVGGIHVAREAEHERRREEVARRVDAEKDAIFQQVLQESGSQISHESVIICPTNEKDNSVGNFPCSEEYEPMDMD